MNKFDIVIAYMFDIISDTRPVYDSLDKLKLMKAISKLLKNRSSFLKEIDILYEHILYNRHKEIILSIIDIDNN